MRVLEREKTMIKERDMCSEQRGIVLLGASTGGPAALAAVLGNLGARFPLPIAVVQHMMPEFTHYLARRLNEAVPMPVREARAGQLPQPGTVLMAPGGQHLYFDHAGRIRLGYQPPRNGVRPSVDVALESAAEQYGSQVLAVILTGMGRDGMEGALEVKRSGGVVLVQDEASSVIFGMPKATIEAGAYDKILSLSALPLYLEGIARRRTQGAKAQWREGS